MENAVGGRRCEMPVGKTTAAAVFAFKFRFKTPLNPFAVRRAYLYIVTILRTNIDSKLFISPARARAFILLPTLINLFPELCALCYLIRWLISV